MREKPKQAPQEWITTAEAAELADLADARIRQLARAGTIGARRWGRDWQIERASLLAYVERQRKAGKKRGPKSPEQGD